MMIKEYVDLYKWDLKSSGARTISYCYGGGEKPYAFCDGKSPRRFLPDNSEIWENL